MVGALLLTARGFWNLKSEHPHGREGIPFEATKKYLSSFTLAPLKPLEIYLEGVPVLLVLFIVIIVLGLPAYIILCNYIIYPNMKYILWELYCKYNIPINSIFT